MFVVPILLTWQTFAAPPPAPMQSRSSRSADARDEALVRTLLKELCADRPAEGEAREFERLEVEHRLRTLQAIVPFGPIAVRPLLEAIESQDEKLREAAADAFELVHESGATAAPQLQQLLKHASIGVRIAAARALGGVKADLVPDAATRQALTALQQDEDFSVRAAAAVALVRIGAVDEWALKVLVKTLDASRALDVMRAADTLAGAWELTPPSSIVEEKLARKALVKFEELLDHEDWKVQRSAADALRRIPVRSEQSARALLEVVRNERALPQVRRSAIDALASNFHLLNADQQRSTLESLKRIIFSDDAEVGGDDAKRLCGDAVADLRPQLHRSAIDAVNRVLVKGDPRRMDPEVRAALYKHLNSKFCDVRRSAADALGDSEGVEDVDGLVRALDSTQPASLRRSALEAIRKLNAAKACPKIRALFDATRDWETRVAAAEALKDLAPATIGEERRNVAAALCRALGDENYRVQMVGVEGLQRLGIDAVDPLESVLFPSDAGAYSTYDAKVRAKVNAAVALARLTETTNDTGRLGVEAALPELAAIVAGRRETKEPAPTDDESRARRNDHVRRQAEKALMSICQTVSAHAGGYTSPEQLKAARHAVAKAGEHLRLATDGSMDPFKRRLETADRDLVVQQEKLADESLYRVVVNNKWTILGATAAAVWLIWLVFAFCWQPRYVWRLGEWLAETFPFGFKFAGLDLRLYSFLGLISGLRFFQFWPRVLDAWVRDHAKKAREGTIGWMQQSGHQIVNDVIVEYSSRATSSGEIPPDEEHVVNAPQAKSFKEICFERFGEDKACLMVVGRPRTGRTGLACNIALRALVPHDRDKPHACSPLTHLAIPAIVDVFPRDLKEGRKGLLDIIGARLVQLLALKTPPSSELFHALLRERRILVVLHCRQGTFDDARSLVDHASFPVNAMILIAEEDRKLLMAADVVRPLQIARDRVRDYVEARLAEPVAASGETGQPGGVIAPTSEAARLGSDAAEAILWEAKTYPFPTTESGNVLLVELSDIDEWLKTKLRLARPSGLSGDYFDSSHAAQLEDAAAEAAIGVVANDARVVNNVRNGLERFDREHPDRAGKGALRAAVVRRSVVDALNSAR